MAGLTSQSQGTISQNLLVAVKGPLGCLLVIIKLHLIHPRLLFNPLPYLVFAALVHR